MLIFLFLWGGVGALKSWKESMNCYPNSLTSGSSTKPYFFSFMPFVFLCFGAFGLLLVYLKSFLSYLGDTGIVYMDNLWNLWGSFYDLAIGVDSMFVESVVAWCFFPQSKMLIIVFSPSINFYFCLFLKANSLSTNSWS